MSTEVKYSVFCLIYSKYFTYCAFFCLTIMKILFTNRQIFPLHISISKT